MDIECLCHERDYLKGILLKARKDIDGAPEGTLRITRSKRNPVYYYRKNLSDRSGEYIKASNRDLAKKLAQKGYAEDIEELINARLAIVESLIASYDKNDICRVHQNYNKARQMLIVPYEMSDEEYVETWKNKASEMTKEYNQYDKYVNQNYMENLYFTTVNGEKVRSKSEVIIADTLSRLGIPYQYEMPFIFHGKVAFRLDFTALNIRKREQIYIEHYGLMDNDEYRDSFFWKMRNFERMGLIQGKNLVMTFEDAEHPLNIGDYMKSIKELCL